MDVENQRAECMWTISEEDKVLFAKKIIQYTLCFCFVLIM